jgi:hypothetical protein
MTDLGTCVICGYEQNPEHIEYVKEAQARHDEKWAKLLRHSHGIQSWGGDEKYRKKIDKEAVI